MPKRPNAHVPREQVAREGPGDDRHLHALPTLLTVAETAEACVSAEAGLQALRRARGDRLGPDRPPAARGARAGGACLGLSVRALVDRRCPGVIQRDRRAARQNGTQESWKRLCLVVQLYR